MSICHYVYLSLCLSAFMSICLHVYLVFVSNYLPVLYLSTYFMSVYPFTSVFLSVTCLHITSVLKCLAVLAASPLTQWECFFVGRSLLLWHQLFQSWPLSSPSSYLSLQPISCLKTRKKKQQILSKD